MLRRLGYNRRNTAQEEGKTFIYKHSLKYQRAIFKLLSQQLKRSGQTTFYTDIFYITTLYGVFK